MEKHVSKEAIELLYKIREMYKEDPYSIKQIIECFYYEVKGNKNSREK